jgi:hypothetical protein
MVATNLLVAEEGVCHNYPSAATRWEIVSEGRCPPQGPLRSVHLPSFSVPTGCPPPQIVVKAGGGHLSQYSTPSNTPQCGAGDTDSQQPVHRTRPTY